MVAQGQLSDLEALDALIASLEALITEAEEAPLIIGASDSPCRVHYRLVGNAAATASDRKARPGEAIFFADNRLVLRCAKTELVRMMAVEATIQAGKTGRGEANVIVGGVVTGMRRVSGGYEVEVKTGDYRRELVTPGQKLRECLEKANAGGWNRWAQDIKDNIDLTGISLPGADLSGFDLCCADFTGADLSGCDLSNAILAGANLSETKLDEAKVAGADFFRAKISRRHAGLLSISGMPEMESVVFVEE